MEEEIIDEETEYVSRDLSEEEVESKFVSLLVCLHSLSLYFSL